MNLSDRLKKRIILIVVVFTLLALVNVIKSKSKEEGYIADKKGDILSIYLPDDDLIQQYNLIAITDKGQQQSITLSLRKDKVRNIEPIEEDNELNYILEDLKNSDLNEIILPKKLPSGSEISWYKNNKFDYSFLIIGGLAIFLIAVCIKIEKDANAKIEKEVSKSILIELPRFTNQILLLLNSSLILNDCIVEIIKGFEEISEKERTLFQMDLIEIKNKSKQLNVGVVYLINEYASKRHIREFSRLTGVMIENIEKGSDIREKIERESEYLWENRKIIAREKGQFIETKMAGPLGLLLVILVVITIAPAILNM